jgi:cell wall-associated NlpC family hydrolase
LLLRTARRLTRVLLTGAVVAGFFVPASTAYAAPSTPATSVQQQINAASTQLETIVEQFNKVNGALAANRTAELKLKAQIAPTLKAVDAAKVRVSQIAAQAYMNGPPTSLAMIVGASSTSTLLDQITTLNQVAVNQKRQINGYAKLTATYTAEKQKLDNLITVQTAQQKSLASQKATINTKLAKLYAIRKAAFGSATTASGGKQATPPAYLPGRGGTVVKFAYAQLGKPYVWAADGPGSYDCSGLVLAAYRKVGVDLTHNAAEQWGEVHHISRSQLEPGDLVFYEPGNIHHVAIYIGGGKVIHAPTFGETVKISGMDMMTEKGYGRP